jgi:hypothetical protein
MGYVTEFNQYRNQFESYYRNFQFVYRRMSSGDYYRDFNVSNWNWTQLDNHLLRTWRTVNQAAWDAQTLALRASRLYDNNPAYRRYADRLITLSEEKIDQMKQEEALTVELEERAKERRETLERLKETNAKLAIGNSDISAGQLQVLANNIMLELAAIQIETGVIEQRRRTAEHDLQNLIAQMKQFEMEAHEDDALNLEHILSKTTR